MSRTEKSSQIAVIVIAAILAVGALDLAQGLFAPIILALTVGVVMSPLSRLVDRSGLPASIAALASLAIILTIIGSVILFTEPVIERATSAYPKVRSEISIIVSDLRETIRGLEEVKDEAEKTISGQGNSPEPNEDSAILPSVTDAIMLAPRVLGQVTIFAGVLFFFMLARRDVYSLVSRVFSGNRQKHVLMKLLAAEDAVGRYFLTVSLINLGYALVVAGVMMAIGLPAALLWGVAAGLMNFIIYLGPAVMMVALLFAGLTAFDGWMAILPAASLLMINLIESQFITPTLLGKTLRMNALAIFLSIVFFLWIWGPIGGIIAIPLVLWVGAVFGGDENPENSGVFDVVEQDSEKFEEQSAA